MGWRVNPGGKVEINVYCSFFLKVSFTLKGCWDVGVITRRYQLQAFIFQYGEEIERCLCAFVAERWRKRNLIQRRKDSWKERSPLEGQKGWDVRHKDVGVERGDLSLIGPFFSWSTHAPQDTHGHLARCRAIWLKWKGNYFWR